MRNISWGSVLAVVMSLVVRESGVCLVALRDGRCDNDDATFDSFPLLYIGGCVSVMGEANAAACRLSFKRAKLFGRAPRRVL